ncbi:FMN-binding protein [Rhizomonospora bruguierae]|uniref:FMN-binding protein n=1 Tax=Rhizomonospora bruguierae TaxID=1581705 RepID=UPI001BCAC449|nr:FMN-binding protein [Micromonospora sp. NBRC 107566]
MRRAVLAITGLAVGTPLLVALKLGAAAPPATADATAASNTQGPTPTGTGKGAKSTPTKAAPTKAPAKKPAGTRTVAGTPQDSPYGTVKVQVVLDGNKITDVQAVQLPQTEPRSISLNERAIPQLRKEVLAKQSADVDTVSGATFTSEGYLNSLQAALDAAGVGA